MDAEDERQTEWDTGPVSRPYTLTGGRTRPRGDRFYALLDVVGLGRATPDRASLGPERIRILDVCRVPVTVADLASAVDLPLGVVRILLDDLAQGNLIEVRVSAPTTRVTDKQLLRQVLDALHALLFSSVGDACAGHRCGRHLSDGTTYAGRTAVVIRTYGLRFPARALRVPSAMTSMPPGAPAGFESALPVADAILYEGYLLYPYRRSAAKNRVRWQFGVLLPRAWADAHGLTDTSVAGSAESWWQQTECLLRAAAGTEVKLRVRFLQLQDKTVAERTSSAGFRPVGTLDLGSRLELSFAEAVPREFDASLPLTALLDGERRLTFRIPGGEDTAPLDDERGRLAGRVIRRRWPVTGSLTVDAVQAVADDPVRLRVRVENADCGTPPTASRDEALRRSLIACHCLLAAERGSFVSLLDPPRWAEAAARACRNVHTFPVLVGEPSSSDLVLSSPILLYDHPRIAPESPGDLHDATEIDEILSLRTLTLSDAEKREARGTDARAAAILDRVDGMPVEMLARMHGAIRPGSGSVAIAGELVRKGSRVKLRPRQHGTDPQDMFLHGRTAQVDAVLHDVDGSCHLAVTIEDDPGAELNRWYGRFRYFAPEEVEPLRDGEDR